MTKQIKKTIITTAIYLALYAMLSHFLDSIGGVSTTATNTMAAVCVGALWLVTIIAIIFDIDSSMIWDALRYNKSLIQIVDFRRTADTYKLDTTAYPVQSWRDTDGIILGQIDGRCIYRPTAAEGNLALFALPGAGKTTAQIIPTALKFGGSVLAIDIKGDILKATKGHRKIKIFAPDEPSTSCHFDPFANLQSMSHTERLNYIEQLADILIPSVGTGKDADYFVQGAKDFFCGVACQMYDRDPDTTFADVITTLVYGKKGDGNTIVAKINANGSADAKAYLASYHATNERNVAGCYNHCVTALRKVAMLLPILDNGGDCISIDTLTQGYDIYIEIPQDKIAIYAPVVSLVVQAFLTDFMQRPDSATDNHPILFLLDEFAQLTLDFATISTALSTLRSKNVSLFLAMQSVAQLSNRYTPDKAREIIDTCAYVSVMSAQDPASREYFSRMIGDKKVLRRHGDSASEATEPIVAPAQFGNLNDQVLIYAHGKYCFADKCYYFLD
ncbi:MAG: type IV secretory system conjugative DNA transfer family protein [Peptococcaceae bacterium]